MTLNFIAGLVTGLPIGLSLGWLLAAWVNRRLDKAAARRFDAFRHPDAIGARLEAYQNQMAQGVYTPQDEPTAELHPDDFDTGRQTR